MNKSEAKKHARALVAQWIEEILDPAGDFNPCLPDDATPKDVERVELELTNMCTDLRTSAGADAVETVEENAGVLDEGDEPDAGDE